MDLSIIIVSWNVQEKLKKNLEAIFKSKLNFSFEVFVLDNNSSDGSVRMIKKYFSQVQLIENKENLGFAKANNQAIRKAKGDFVLLLNPDMKVEENTLQNMLEWMKKNNQATVASCKLLTENKEIIKHVRRFPRIFDQLAVVLKLPHIFLGVLDKYILKNFDYTKATKVDSIRGGFFMINMEAVKKLKSFKEKTIPNLDERYFIWFEEVDFCKQVCIAGGEVWYSPEVKCIDYVGQSFNQVNQKIKQNYFKDSQLKYFKKWHPFWQYFVLKIAWFFGGLIGGVAGLFNIKGRGKT
jgi:GT2 family glycosyltransferase